MQTEDRYFNSTCIIEKGFEKWEHNNYMVMTWWGTEWTSQLPPTSCLWTPQKKSGKLFTILLLSRRMYLEFLKWKSEDLFSLRQADKSLEDHYNHFKGMWWTQIVSSSHWQYWSSKKVAWRVIHLQVSFGTRFSTRTTLRIDTNRWRLDYPLCRILSWLQNLLVLLLIPLLFEGCALVLSTSQGTTPWCRGSSFEGRVLVVGRVTLGSVLIVIKQITLLTNIGSCMANLCGLLELLICLMVLTPLNCFLLIYYTRLYCFTSIDESVILSRFDYDSLIQKMYSVTDIATLAHLDISC